MLHLFVTKPVPTLVRVLFSLEKEDHKDICQHLTYLGNNPSLINEYVVQDIARMQVSVGCA